MPSMYYNLIKDLVRDISKRVAADPRISNTPYRSLYYSQQYTRLTELPGHTKRDLENCILYGSSYPGSSISEYCRIEFWAYIRNPSVIWWEERKDMYICGVSLDSIEVRKHLAYFFGLNAQVPSINDALLEELPAYIGLDKEGNRNYDVNPYKVSDSCRKRIAEAVAAGRNSTEILNIWNKIEPESYARMVAQDKLIQSLPHTISIAPHVFGEVHRRDCIPIFLLDLREGYFGGEFRGASSLRSVDRIKFKPSEGALKFLKKVSKTKFYFPNIDYVVTIDGSQAYGY